MSKSLTSRETDDYGSDVKFGHWLRDQRVKAGFSLEIASKESCIAPQRLKSLEIGISERGITQHESEALCKLYKVALKDFLEHAKDES